MSSPWDPISAGSSRRSSMTDTSQHLNRLHRKAQTMHTPTATPTPTQQRCPSAMSVASECTIPSEPVQQVRRASDPVRTMDRNFGVGGQLSRHRSYTQLDATQQRMPIHGQMVRQQQQQVISISVILTASRKSTCGKG